MQKYVEPQKELDVFCEADVIVVGGGPAGIGAALAAGRTGAKTVIIERFGCLGGLQTQCYQVMFTFCDPMIHGGVMAEILNRLEEGGATVKLKDLPAPTEKGVFQQLIAAKKGKENVPRRMLERAGYWWQWGREFDPEYYKLILDDMMSQANVRRLYHTFATGAIREGDTLKGVVIESKEGRKAVYGKVVIDTTGEGDIAWKSGAPVIGGEGVQLGRHKGTQGGMVNSFYIGGVDLARFDAFRKEQPGEWLQAMNGRKTIEQGIQEGYPDLRKDAGIILYPKPGGRIWLMFPLYAVRGEGRTWHIDEITKAEIQMRKQAWGIHRLLKDKVPGFEKSYVEKTPVVPLNGEPHRMEGEYILTVGDMREGKDFDDAIGINNMIPDLYTLIHRLSFDILPHDIPYRCLISRGVDNLMAAGTTMSCGSLAMTGLRYCAPSLIQGQAAGTAAALASKNSISPKAVNIKQLQDKLREQGAVVSVRDLSDEVLDPYRAIQELSLSLPKPELYDEIASY